MKYYLLNKEGFSKYANSAFTAIFGYSADLLGYKNDKFIVVFNNSDDFIGFVSYYELTNDSVYLVAGGVMPEHRGACTLKYFNDILNVLKAYNKIELEVSNNNFDMLRICMKLKFKIVGLSHYHNETVLKLYMEK